MSTFNRSRRGTLLPARRGSFSRSRRGFLQVSAAAGGALCLELSMPSIALGEARAADAELNAWRVVVRADDAVIIRIARSEMGQGSFDGPANAGRRGIAMRLVESDTPSSFLSP